MAKFGFQIMLLSLLYPLLMSKTFEEVKKKAEDEVKELANQMSIVYGERC